MSALPQFLDQLFKTYHSGQYLSSDPLEFPHQYSDPWDREAVALLSALLAYGNVKQIRRSVAEALRRIESTGTTPSEFVRALKDAGFRREAERAFRGYVHRFNVGKDLVLLFTLLERSWREHGSLGAHFVRYLEPQAETIALALSSLIAEWRNWAGTRGRKSSFAYFLTSPADGSCCKRWCMFLRWMGRNDGLDLGLWNEGKLVDSFPDGRRLRADQLIIPLDTHTGRISQYLGLTDRKCLDWKTATEVTLRLKACDPEDPTRYDFALSRLGILDVCQKTFRVQICNSCDLFQVCRFAQKQLSGPSSSRYSGGCRSMPFQR